MSHLWQRSDEWVDHAPCGGDPTFITEPRLLTSSELDRLQETCAGCPVRPECIELNTSPVRDFLKPKVTRPSHSIWVAGVWLDEPADTASSELLAAKKAQLNSSLQMERVTRPSSIL